MDKPITNIVTDVLVYYDLEGILYNGDEYLVEAESITAFIINNRHKLSGNLLADNIQYVFLRYFGSLVDYVDCIWMAKDIMRRLNEQGVM